MPQSEPKETNSVGKWSEFCNMEHHSLYSSPNDLVKEMKEVDMGWACSARGKDCERAHNFGLEV
jgi:hypothetical protein